MSKVRDEVLLKVENMYKSFGPTKAIADVSVTVRRGEIHGLIGENGSGKSTLCNMIVGTVKPDGGTMILEGSPLKPSSMVDAKNKGISILLQEQGTINGMTVAENIFMGSEKNFMQHGLVSKRKMTAECKKVLAEIGLEMDPHAVVDNYSFEDRKLIEVARAIYSHPSLLIVDETTTALSQRGRSIVYKLIHHMKEDNRAVIFITHDLNELMEQCDVVSVLRDGQYVATKKCAEITDDEVRQLMIGRDLAGNYYRNDEDQAYTDDVVLSVEGATYAPHFSDISLQLHKGEILGIGGLTDCGMHELMKVIFGAVKPDEGRIIVKGKLVKSAADAISLGMAYLPKDRDQESLFLDSSITENVTVMSGERVKKGIFRNKSAEKQLAESYAGQLQVKMQSINQMVRALSGGNKQKVVIAKWLANDSDILLMDCPTRGIDIGVKASIYSLIEDLKKAGKSIVMVSEEQAELIGMADRLLILKNGKIQGELHRQDNIGENDIIKLMI